MELKKQRTWVKISRQALINNLAEISTQISPKTQKMVIVKSNAYGHGIIESAKVFEKAGANFLGVDSFAEALLLRENRLKKPILVLGWTSEENFSEAVTKNISLTISNFDSLKMVQKLSPTFSNKLKIHIKIDTGLHRQGFSPEDLDTVLKILKKTKNLNVEGLYSHFASAESSKHFAYTKKQISIFKKCIENFKQAGFEPITHIGASAATMLYPESHFDMVRLGISAYGLWPSEEIKKKLSKKIKLEPALNWQAIVTEIKKVKKGEPIGYDCSEKVRRDSVVAIIPVGYWHGIPRHASKKGEVLVNGKIAKILGKVSMDMIIVDITDCGSVKTQSIATIIGDADNWAQKADTINYEIVIRINPEITRIYF